MAGAHRLRYQPFRPCTLGNSESREPGPGTCRCQRGKRAGGICGTATIGFRQAAVSRPKESRLEATAATQSEGAWTPARAHGGAATAIRLVRSQVLVSRTAFTQLSSDSAPHGSTADPFRMTIEAQGAGLDCFVAVC